MSRPNLNNEEFQNDPKHLQKLHDEINILRTELNEAKKTNRAFRKKNTARQRQRRAIINFANFVATQLFWGRNTKSAADDCHQAWTNYISNESESTEPPNVPVDETVKFAITLLVRFTRTRLIYILIGFFVSGISIFLLLTQLHMLSRQNNILSSQSKIFEDQNKLAEGQRRSALVPELSSVIERLNSSRLAWIELENAETEYIAPAALIGRIIALSRALRPYQFLDAESDFNRPGPLRSPERGLLLLALASVPDEVLNQTIKGGADFSYADLRAAELRNVKMDGIWAMGCDFTNANLTGSSLVGANLQNTTFDNASLEDTTCSHADFRNASFNGAIIKGMELRHNGLANTNYYDNIDWQNAIIGPTSKIHNPPTDSHVYNTIMSIQSNIDKWILVKKHVTKSIGTSSERTQFSNTECWIIQRN